MKLRIVSVLSILMLVLAGSVVGAQDMFCGGLGEADCALLEASGESLPTSTRFSGDVAINVLSAEDNIDITLNMSGGYAVDTAAVDQFNAFIEGLDVDAIIADPASLDIAALSAELKNAFSAADAELMIALVLPPEASDPMIPNPLDLNLWFVDGVGYVDLAPFSMMDPTFDGVYGVDLNEALDFATAFISPEMLAEIDPAELEAMLAEANIDLSMNNDMTEIPDFGDAVMIERLADENGMAVFSTTVDLAALFANEEFRALAIESNDGSDLSDAELEAVLNAMNGALISSSMNVVTSIDPATQYGMRSTASMEMVLDTDALVTAMEAELGEDMGEGIGEVTITFNSDFARSDVDSVSEIPAPAGSTVVPLMELLASM